MTHNIFNVIFSKKADLQFKKLPKNIQIRIISVFKRIIINPHKYVRRVIGTNFFRVRIGDYRAVVDINTKDRNIIILFIGHRKNIYNTKL